MNEAEGIAPPISRNRRAPGGWLRENIRQIISAIVVVLLVRIYVVEIFKIPTGSMASTLYGVHADIACPTCRWNFTVGAPEGEVEKGGFRDKHVECPNCGTSVRLGDFPDHGGHKIVAVRLRAGKRKVLNPELELF